MTRRGSATQNKHNTAKNTHKNYAHFTSFDTIYMLKKLTRGKRSHLVKPIPLRTMKISELADGLRELWDGYGLVRWTLPHDRFSYYTGEAATSRKMKMHRTYCPLIIKKHATPHVRHL